MATYATGMGLTNMMKLFGEFMDRVPTALRRISEVEASEKSGPAKWSKKEILGHLIDSAANNHQRFVRVQHEAGLALPGYAQDAWVASQHYHARTWTDLVDLWTAYNAHLLHLLRHMPAPAWNQTCTIGDSPSLTLLFVAEDYVKHLEHHFKQILGPSLS